MYLKFFLSLLEPIYSKKVLQKFSHFSFFIKIQAFKPSFLKSFSKFSKNSKNFEKNSGIYKNLPKKFSEKFLIFQKSFGTCSEKNFSQNPSIFKNSRIHSKNNSTKIVNFTIFKTQKFSQ